MKDKTTLEYERRIADNAKKAKKLADDAKALYREGQKLKRDARTHHLCNLGGMLENYLKEPGILEEDDVRHILDGVFADPKVQMALDRLLAKKRGPVPMADEAAAATVDDEQE